MPNFHYTYYSYEPYGRGYIGVRQCSCLPEEDTHYFGSYSDVTFQPTEKIILSLFESREEAVAAEVKLHSFYDVGNNIHFANKARQLTTGFSFSSNGERNGKGNPTYGKVRITNGDEERVVSLEDIPSGWYRGRSTKSKEKSANRCGPRGHIKTRGKMYSTFVSESQADETILDLPLRVLARRYSTSHTSIRRWKASVVHPTVRKDANVA
jgi:hypothetical protein